jgi:hypothetical protein
MHVIVNYPGSDESGRSVIVVSFLCLRFLRPARLIDRPVPVLAKCKTDKPKHHQDSAGYYKPMRVLHRREHRLFPPSDNLDALF